MPRFQILDRHDDELHIRLPTRAPQVQTPDASAELKLTLCRLRHGLGNACTMIDAMLQTPETARLDALRVQISHLSQRLQEFETQCPRRSVANIGVSEPPGAAESGDTRKIP